MFSRVDSFALEATAPVSAYNTAGSSDGMYELGLAIKLSISGNLSAIFANARNSPAGPVPTAPEIPKNNLESSMLSVSFKRLSTNDQLRGVGKAYSSALKLYRRLGR